jgi:hypothetical protein
MIKIDGKAQKTVKRDYGYNIYRNGYLSVVTSQAYDVEISNMSITIPKYSTMEFPAEPSSDNSHTNAPKTGENLPLTAACTVPCAVFLAYVMRKRKKLRY